MSILLNPCPWQSIPSMFDANCARYSEHTAIIDGETVLRYSELAEKVQQCAAAMASQGIKTGDTIGLWAPNSWQWIVCTFAAWQLGAVVVPVSSRLKAREVGPPLKKSGARLLFSIGDCAGSDLPSLLAAQYGRHSERPFAELPELEQVICFDTKTAFDGYIYFADFIAATNSVVPDSRTTGDALCEILFTSGTTGEPKGVMLNHQQILQAYWDWSDIGGLNEQDRFLVIPPFSHGFGINAGVIACVMRGMTHVVVDFFNPETTQSLIQENHVSVMSGPPALFASLAQQCDPATLSSLRVAYIGAAHVPEEMIKCMHDDLGINRVINAYGLIEGCVVSMTRAEDPIAVISKTVGRPLPNVNVTIVDDEKNILPAGETGEILVQSYGVMQGYFEAPELTADTLDKDGWLSTGDIGILDNKGNLSIVGRKKDMFICNGFNVYPAEVEDMLLQHTSIDQAAVVAIEHPRKGEVGIAFVMTNQSAEQPFDQQSVIEWAKAIMASYKVPQIILEVEKFPLNANGKVQKDELKALATVHKNCE